MNTIRIGSETRSLADATESRIDEQINRRRHGGQNVCEEVAIDTGGLNTRLATPGCGGAEEVVTLRTPMNKKCSISGASEVSTAQIPPAGTSWIF